MIAKIKLRKEQLFMEGRIRSFIVKTLVTSTFLSLIFYRLVANEISCNMELNIVYSLITVFAVSSLVQHWLFRNSDSPFRYAVLSVLAYFNVFLSILLTSFAMCEAGRTQYYWAKYLLVIFVSINTVQSVMAGFPIINFLARIAPVVVLLYSREPEPVPQSSFTNFLADSWQRLLVTV